MFKVLVLQRIYNLSDDQTEYQINDRMSFMRFLGLGLEDRVPDAKTIWLFRNTLAQTDAARKLFELFGKQLQDAHLVTRTGTIVDATFVDAPHPRTTREEREYIKRGETPEEWKKPENKNSLRQKDWVNRRSTNEIGLLLRQIGRNLSHRRVHAPPPFHRPAP